MSLQEQAGRRPPKDAIHSNDHASATGSSGGSMSIDSFCARNEISRSFFYKMKKLGIGPDLCQFGTTVRISYAAEAAWLKRAARAAKKTSAV
jgi:hypothetical protein